MSEFFCEVEEPRAFRDGAADGCMALKDGKGVTVASCLFLGELAIFGEMPILRETISLARC
jgi:hypothetical protein